MNRHLALTLSLLAVAALPAAVLAQPAAATKGSKSAACSTPKYVAIDGELAAGSVLEQVEGFDTDVLSDDRYSGTLVVKVARPAHKKKAKKGAGKKRTYALSAVRVKGLGEVDDEEAPGPGTRVQLIGRAIKACNSSGGTPTATAAKAGGKVVVIDSVRFRAAKAAAGERSDDSDDSAEDEPAEDDALLPGEEPEESGSSDSGSADNGSSDGDSGDDSSAQGETDDDDATYATHR